MFKNIALIIFLLQLSLVSWSQMDLFNKTYDLGALGEADGFTDLRYKNDTVYVSGSTFGWGFGYRHFSSFNINTPQNIATYKFMNNTINSYYPGLGKSLMVGVNKLIMTGSVDGDSIPDALSYALITNFNGDSLRTVFFPDSTYIQASLLGISEEFIISAGSKTTNSNIDFWLVKYDTSGNIIWENNYGGNSIEEVFSLDHTSDGGYVMAGYTNSFGSGLRDVYVVKTDSMGIFQWQRVFGGVKNDIGFVKALENGDILVYGGTVNSISNETSSYIRKFDSLGIVKWHKEYGYSINYDDVIQSMSLSTTGYIFAGFSKDATDNNPLGWLLKTDFDGNELWSRRFRKRDSDNYFRDVLELPNGDIMVCGFVFSEGNLSQDAWLVRTNCLGFDTLPEANGEVVVLAEKKVRLQNMSKAWGNCIIDWGDGTSNYLYEDYSTYIEHIYPNTQARTIKITAIACGVEDTMSFTIVPTMVNVTKETLDSFSLYPNPTSAKVTLQIPAFQDNDYEVSFYNNLGKRVAISPIATGIGYEINTSEISRGIYQVVLVHRNGVRSVKKLVVQ
jgi:hypothetical protein